MIALNMDIFYHDHRSIMVWMAIRLLNVLNMDILCHNFMPSSTHGFKS